MRATCLLASLLFFVTEALVAQDGPPPNGPRAVDPGWHALVSARVIVAPGRVLEGTTIIVRDGRITAVERGGAPPAGARVHELAGRTVHAAFVDAHVPIAMPRPPAGAPGAHWHAGVMPQRDALDGDGLAAETVKELRELGFGAAAVFPGDGLVRGQGTVVTLEDPRDGARRRSVPSTTTTALAFETQSGTYPASKMGAVAMLRQTLLSLDLDTQFLFATSDELDLLRAMRAMAELEPDARTLFLGTGLEFRRLDAIAAGQPWLIVPLAFPKAPDVSTLEARERVSLRQMLTWELAPTNAARVHDAGLSFALTTDRLGKRSEFVAALRSAIRHGLPPDAALAALTTTPATMTGAWTDLGTIEVGKLANLCVVRGDPFGEDSVLEAVWIAGVRHEPRDPTDLTLAGAWRTDLRIGDVAVERIEITARKGGRGIDLLLVAADKRAKANNVRVTPQSIDFAIDGKDLGASGRTALSATLTSDRLLFAAGGWTATRDPSLAVAETPATDEEKTREATGRDDALALSRRALPVPLGAYGRLAPPRPQRVAVRHATIWTSGPAGIVEDATLHVDGGKVLWIGRAADAPDFDAEVVIDAAGRHVTPGLIDCHSHTGIVGGVNEGTQAVTAEVRIGDVLDPDDVDWYRQLAGGVTCVNQLHGSANPIGGQSQTTKPRWGVRDPETMKLDGAMPGIKFALGENVKRSRASDNTRYPNTRMGVEALIRDRFLAAREYGERWKGAKPELPATIPARDLELEALHEVLEGKRLVHCHSYRQDEILMLCRVAKEFGFRIGTFQHGLECYKVAEAVKDAAIGASIFSDWWAYKYEVFDAIPENAAIMTKVGVCVSMNSDSDELARRLNTEAAKAVKYGGLSRAQALHLVTINPAIQLGVHQRIGSLQTGKDADFAIWSGDPLSPLSRCEETWIDGARHWSRAEDLAARPAIDAERARLVQRILVEAGGGEVAADPPGGSHAAGDCGCEEVRR